VTADIRSFIDEAEVFAPEPPRPLRRALPPAEPFPIEALGGLLGPAAEAIHHRIQAPLAICAQSCLATATLAVQGYGNVLMPYGQTRPLSGFFLSIAESGERKTSADNDALAPVTQFEDILRGRQIASQATFENEMQVWESERRRILNDKKLDPMAKGQALGRLGTSPDGPLIPMLTCPEPTFEGLSRQFIDGWPALGVFSSEGGQFVGGFGMSQDQRLKTAAGLSSLWDGSPLRRVRAGDGSRLMPGRRLSMNLMLQPEVASALLADSILVDQGLLSRMLVVYPGSLMGSRLWRDLSPEHDVRLARYTSHILNVLNEPLPLKRETRNELLPPVLTFSEAARSVWIAFADHIETQLRRGQSLETMRPFAAKVAEHAARLSGVFALLEDIYTRCVDKHQIDAGILLAQHYLSEWNRLHDAAATRPEIINAEKLLAWLATWEQEVVGLPEIYQRGPNAIRDQRTARDAVAVLEDHGWLERVDGGTKVTGTFRRDAWRIVESGS
jgi:hypothetical protein